MFHRLFWRNLILPVPVIATSGMVERWLGYDLPGTAWIPPLIGTAIFVYGVRATVRRRACCGGWPHPPGRVGGNGARQLRGRCGIVARKGGAVLYFGADGEVVGAFTTTDPVRQESRAVVDALHARSIEVALITGDSQAVADAVAHTLGIDEVFAQVLPDDTDKAGIALQERGRRVAMVGDGVNGAPALARVDVGLVIGAGEPVSLRGPKRWWEWLPLGPGAHGGAGVDHRAIVSVVMCARERPPWGPQASTGWRRRAPAPIHANHPK